MTIPSLTKQVTPDLKSLKMIANTDRVISLSCVWLSTCVKLNDSADFSRVMPFTVWRPCALFALSVSTCDQFKVFELDVYFNIT